jgi:hypothetical protein
LLALLVKSMKTMIQALCAPLVQRDNMYLQDLLARVSLSAASLGNLTSTPILLRHVSHAQLDHMSQLDHLETVHFSSVKLERQTLMLTHRHSVLIAELVITHR